MPTILTPQTLKSKVVSKRLVLADGAETTLHVAKYDRLRTRPRVAVMEPAERLLDYCQQKEFGHAIVGGFFLRNGAVSLGDLWVNGKKQPSVPFDSKEGKNRGSMHVDLSGNLSLGLRNEFRSEPENDLLQAGPLLLKNGVSQVKNGDDIEGFSVGAHQFDSDITEGRYPRSAIGADEHFIYSAVCEGRSKSEAGLTLAEFADALGELGAKTALNLDGGSSASLIVDGRLVNHSHSDDECFPRGRPIHTAIVFEAK